MMSGNRTFLLDANVLIAAHRGYYAFDLCPGYWRILRAKFDEGRVFSTKRVRAELMRGSDQLSEWVKSELPEGFFLDDSTPAVISAYRPLMAWVTGKAFHSAAQAKFATDADGWLIAMAGHSGHCLVTHEVRAEGAKAKVPMPNVCHAFSVSYCDTFEMLRELGCAFH